MKQVVAALVFMNIAGISGVFAEKYGSSAESVGNFVGKETGVIGYEPQKTQNGAKSFLFPGFCVILRD